MGEQGVVGAAEKGMKLLAREGRFLAGYCLFGHVPFVQSKIGDETEPIFFWHSAT